MVERNTHLYSDRDRTQTERESQTDDLAEKTEELTDRVIGFERSTGSVLFFSRVVGWC